MIYLDSASTAKYSNTDDIVIDTMANAMKRFWRNPSSLYATDVKKKIEKCRVNVANFIGANPDEIYYTSGSSESNNWAIRGFVDEALALGRQNIHIITTPIEHKSILGIVENKALNVRIYYCDIDKFGFVDCKSLKSLLEVCRYEDVLVSVQYANNEIGTIQRLKEISDLVHKYNGIFHVDATQVLPHIPIDVEEMGIDMMSASGHKVSPVLKGIGFLYKRNGVNIRPLIYGTQEQNLRGGTENSFGIIGLSKALEYCDVSQKKIDEMCRKRNYFIVQLESKFGCKLNGSRDERLPNNINVTFPQDITGESLLYTLDSSGVQISTSSACNSHSIIPSFVLKAINLSDRDAMRTIRITLSDDITYENIDYVVKEIEKVLKIIEV